MKLYHGTSYAQLQKILQDGIQPRGQRESCWEVKSRSDMCYLTTAYAFYFGMQAVGESVDGRVVVFEIDQDNLDPALLYPDEDFVQQVLKILKQPCEHEKIRKNIKQYQHLTEKSISGIGNCAYRGTLLPEWIDRYCVLNSARRTELAMEILDPTISILNYQLVGKKYRDLIAWFFGDREMLPSVDQFELIPGGLSSLLEQAKEYWITQSRNRTGIEVVVF